VLLSQAEFLSQGMNCSAHFYCDIKIRFLLCEFYIIFGGTLCCSWKRCSLPEELGLGGGEEDFLFGDKSEPKIRRVSCRCL